MYVLGLSHVRRGSERTTSRLCLSSSGVLPLLWTSTAITLIGEFKPWQP
jgi:hypothetical protein